MRVIGLDIHRAFAEAVAWDEGKLKRLGRVKHAARRALPVCDDTVARRHCCGGTDRQCGLCCCIRRLEHHRNAEWRDLSTACARRRSFSRAGDVTTIRFVRMPRSATGRRPRKCSCQRWPRGLPTGSVGHAPAGATADAKLTFQQPHPAGANQYSATDR